MVECMVNCLVKCLLGNRCTVTWVVGTTVGCYPPNSLQYCAVATRHALCCQ